MRVMDTLENSRAGERCYAIERNWCGELPSLAGTWAMSTSGVRLANHTRQLVVRVVGLYAQPLFEIQGGASPCPTSRSDSGPFCALLACLAILGLRPTTPAQRHSFH